MATNSSSNSSSNMNSLLAKLRAKTSNPAGPNPVINPIAAEKEQETKLATEPTRNLILPKQNSKLGLELQEKLCNLENMLLDKHPMMPNLLREIHKALHKQPENVILMDEDELHVLVEGLDRQTGSELAAMNVKTSKSTSGKAKAAKVSSADLGF